MKASQSFAVGDRCAQFAGNHRQNGAEVAWADPPQVDVRPAISIDFNASPHFLGHVAVCIHVKQQGALRRLNTPYFVFKDTGMTTIVMPMVVTRRIAAAQQSGARDVDQQSDNSDRDGLVEVDADGGHQATYGLVAVKQRDHGQHDRAGEFRQIPQLARAEGEARVRCVALRTGVRQRCDQQRPMACVDMCSPSAIKATEPNTEPPIISTAIITPHKAITVHALRSLRACPAPGKTRLWSESRLNIF